MRTLETPNRIKNGRSVPDGFSYRSDNNTQWMSQDELKGWIERHKSKIGKI